MALKTAQIRRRYRYWLLGVTGSVATILLILRFIWLPSLDLPGPTPPRLKCDSQLRQIGQAIVMYANDHQGKYPDSLSELMSYLMDDDSNADAPRWFICPASNDTPATGPTTQAIAANLDSGGHLSYIYVGRGLTLKTATENTVVAFEPMSNHGDGINILFGDGHVDFDNESQAAPLFAKWRNGRFPVTMPIE